MKVSYIALALAFAGSVVTAVRAEVPKVNPDTGVPVPLMFEFPDLEPIKPFWSKRITGYLTTRDGVKLRYSVLLPKTAGPSPVIMSYNGYDAGSIGGKPYLKWKTAMGYQLDQELLAAGYAVMGVSAAGTGCSQGKFAMIGPQFGKDGADAVQFAANQSWSNGNVGMVNWSYGGASQLATAINQPANLRAIAPGMVLGDYQRDIASPGGVPQPGFMGPWRNILHNYWSYAEEDARDIGDQQCLANIAENLKYEGDHSVLRMAFAHPFRDEVMQAQSLSDHADKIKVPVLSFEAFQDQATGVRGGHYRNKLDPSKTWLVQTNGGHDLYMAPAWHATLLQFLDHFVKGKNNGFERTPHTRIWMETTSTGTSYLDRDAKSKPTWVIERGTITPADVQVRTFHLTSGGRLSDSTGSGDADAYDYPGAGVSVNDFEANTVWGTLPANWKETSAAYTSAPLDADMMAYGTGSADLWVVGTGSDADVQVTLTEVLPNGQEMYVQRGWLRLSNRKIDPAQSTELLPVPVGTADAQKEITAGTAVLARVEVQKMGHLFHKGSKLRIWIDSPGDTGGFSFATYSQKQKLYVLHNAKYDSQLKIGTLKDVKAPAKRAECGTVLLQPCRPDPLKL